MMKQTDAQSQRLGATYRLMAQLAAQQLHEAHRREQALQRQVAALRDEIRRYIAAQVKS